MDIWILTLSPCTEVLLHYQFRAAGYNVNTYTDYVGKLQDAYSRRQKPDEGCYIIHR